MTGKRIALVVVILVAFGMVFWYRNQVFSEPPRAPKPQLVLLTGGSGPYWQTTIRGAEAAARELDVELQIEAPEESEDYKAQLAVLEKLELPGIDGIAISPVNAEQQTDAINKLSEQLNIVTFDSDAPESNRHGHVGTSNFAAGRACARLVGEAMPEGGKIGVFLANVTKENLIDRKGGFQEMIDRMADDAEGDELLYTVAGYYEDDGSDQRCVENLDKLLKDAPDVSCIVALNARQGPILLEELKKRDLVDQIKMVTFDANDETLEGIENGHIYATIAQDPYKFGYEAVSMLVKLCQGKDTDLPIVGRSSLYVGIDAIRKDNLEKHRELMRARQQSKPEQQQPPQKDAV